MTASLVSSADLLEATRGIIESDRSSTLTIQPSTWNDLTGVPSEHLRSRMCVSDMCGGGRGSHLNLTLNLTAESEFEPEPEREQDACVRVCVRECVSVCVHVCVGYVCVRW